MLTFDYGDFRLRLPKTANWVENPMLLRPQLLLLRCGPLDSPSTIHIEMLAVNPRARGQGQYFSPISPSGIIQGYYHKDWTPIPAPLAPGFKCAGFKKNIANNNLPREETHILSLNDTGLRLYMKLSPQLDPKNETAMRASLSRLAVVPKGVEIKSEPNSALVLPSAPAPAKTIMVETIITQSVATAPVPSSPSQSTPQKTTLTLPGSRAAATAAAVPLFLTDTVVIRQSKRPGESGWLHFNYGGVELSIPKTTTWFANPSVERPRLLLLQCGPMESPSSVHFELLGANPQKEEKGVRITPSDLNAIIQEYSPPQWVPIVPPSPVPMGFVAGFKKSPAHPDSNPSEAREEHCLLKINDAGFRLRMTLSPQLKPEDETILRQAIGKSSINLLQNKAAGLVLPQ